MCPSCEPEAAANTNGNGHANGTSSGTNGTNGSNGSNGANGFTAVQTKSNPHQHRSNPYQPVGDFLSNVNNFKIIESTLREGEQFANAFFDLPKKIEIAKALDDFGVDYSCMLMRRNQIELTSPAASEQSRTDCEAICKLGLKAKILTHIRCHMDDARIAVQTGVDGVRLSDVVIGTSSYLMEHSHGKDMTYITNTAIEVINYVKSHNIEIRFSSEDSFRSNLVDLLSIYSTVDKIGVNRVGIADTVGCASPRQVYDLIRTLRGVVSCDIETHFHNDTGCAIANAYCALEAGATHIDTSVLGIGERNGITPLGGLMARMIVADRDYVMGKYKLHKLKDIEDLVAQAVEVNIPFNNSRATQLQIEMTDAQYKECTASIKALADIRPIAIDDADSIIRAFHRNLRLEKAAELLPNMTDEERAALAQKEKDIDIPEKRELDAEAEIPLANNANNSVTA
ncbi:Homocitrate synthase, mitochondrial [Lachnellula willkommii]|uniref:Homocitrate synthase, mitochondrial n=1 Tax=Lachnellula willkommii TaxID=215461 RepID=A0A559MEE6_9HELO|nr:Homocitrate synthase, mitochondrial [Lachnellula willkommii]